MMTSREKDLLSSPLLNWSPLQLLLGSSHNASPVRGEALRDDLITAAEETIIKQPPKI